MNRFFASVFIIFAYLSKNTDLLPRIFKNASKKLYFKEKIMEFRLIPGVFIPDVGSVKREYRLKKDRLLFSLSADSYSGFFPEAVKKLPEPVFFFVEIPGDNDKMRTYYLDNCTRPVALAILKRYGGILYSDGVIRWGFGSHKTDEEIYTRDYQTVSVYSQKITKFSQLLESLGYSENPKAVLTWDILSDDNTGECVNVESDGEGFSEMINNLTSAGMYCQK